MGDASMDAEEVHGQPGATLAANQRGHLLLNCVLISCYPSLPVTKNVPLISSWLGPESPHLAAVESWNLREEPGKGSGSGDSPIVFSHLFSCLFIPQHALTDCSVCAAKGKGQGTPMLPGADMEELCKELPYLRCPLIQLKTQFQHVLRWEVKG